MKLIFSANSFIYIYKLRFDIIKKLKNLNYEIIVVAGEDRFKNIIQNLGFETHSIGIQPNKKNIFSDLYLALQYLYIYSKIKPDIVFHSTIKPNIYGSIATRILGIRTINNISGLGTVFFKKNFIQRLVIFLYKISQKKVDTMLFQNDDDLNFFLEKSICKKNQTKRIPGSGVNLNKFNRSKFHANEQKNRFEFLYIGRLVREKGILEYIESAQSLSDKYDNIDFKIIGDFDEKNKSSIKENELNSLIKNYKNIQHLPYQDKIQNFIVNTNCIVLPSWREGLSNILLESCSLETPAITSNVTGCNDVIIDEVNGFLCKHKNSTDLAIKMEKFYLLSREEQIILGKKGREIVEKKFSIEKVFEDYISILS